MSESQECSESAESIDRQAVTDLLPLVYDELRRLAAYRLAQESPGHTLQPTALVHEAFLRLAQTQGSRSHWQGRAHFFGAAAEAMRRILVDAARHKARIKRGGDRQRQELTEGNTPVTQSCEELLTLDEALVKLATEEPVAARVVELHFFAGLSIEEAAETINISRATAYRHWNYARAWLRVEIGASDEGATASGPIRA